MTAAGPLGVVIGLAFALSFPGEVGDTVLAAAVAAAVVGELTSTPALRRALRRAGELDAGRRRAGGRRRSARERPRRRRPGRGAGVQLLVLAALGGLVALVVRWGGVPSLPGAGTIVSVGFLLLAGSLTASLLERIGLPHLTGYLLAGALAGPHLLGLVDQQAVADLEPVNALALSLIALAGGAELRLDGLRQGLRSLGWSTLLHNLPVLLISGGVFYLARPLIPFARELPGGALLAVALLWGVVAITRSPAATLAIITQTRASGRLTTATVNFVMSSDVVVVVLLALALTVTRPLLSPGATISLDRLRRAGARAAGERLGGRDAGAAADRLPALRRGAAAPGAGGHRAWC